MTERHERIGFHNQNIYISTLYRASRPIGDNVGCVNGAERRCVNQVRLASRKRSSHTRGEKKSDLYHSTHLCLVIDPETRHRTLDLAFICAEIIAGAPESLNYPVVSASIEEDRARDLAFTVREILRYTLYTLLLTPCSLFFSL